MNTSLSFIEKKRPGRDYPLSLSIRALGLAESFFPCSWLSKPRASVLTTDRGRVWSPLQCWVYPGRFHGLRTRTYFKEPLPPPKVVQSLPAKRPTKEAPRAWVQWTHRLDRFYLQLQKGMKRMNYIPFLYVCRSSWYRFFLLNESELKS